MLLIDFSLCLLLILRPSGGHGASKPNIFFILVDDLGWGDVGFHRNVTDSEIKTPFLDNLIKTEGLEFTRHYVHFTCTPTRSSFQSGRLPMHVQQTLDNPDQQNAGIPRNMTCIGNKMQEAGYTTHIVGKWDCGMATFDHTPQGRGYNTSLIYFEHKNDYFTQIQMQSSCQNVYPNIVDLWHSNNTSPNKDDHYNKPAYGKNGTQYEEFMFEDQVLRVLDDHANGNNEPFFLVYTPHIAHCPLQIPNKYLDGFNFTDDENSCKAQTAYVNYNLTDGNKFKCRSTYHAMVSLLDGVLENIINKLKDTGLWNNTFIALSSDNGGPLVIDESGANNTPLKGGKYSPWEGGIRATALASGGYLPSKRYGEIEGGMIHVADWLVTFCMMGGLTNEECVSDDKAAKHNLPGIDSFNVWPLVSGSNETSPRTEFPISKEAYMSGEYKLLTGGKIDYAGWQGEIYPNASTVNNTQISSIKQDCTNGCLYNVVNDMTEHDDIASSNSDIVTQLTKQLKTASESFYSNNDTGVNSCPSNTSVECACWMAKYYWKEFFGPYQYLGDINVSSTL